MQNAHLDDVLILVNKQTRKQNQCKPIHINVI